MRNHQSRLENGSAKIVKNSRKKRAMPIYREYGVPTSVELDNNFNGRKYTVNSSNNKVVIPRSICALLTLAAILLALLSALIVFLLVPKCGQEQSDSQSLFSDKPSAVAEEIDPRLPVELEPLYYKLNLVPDFQRQTIDGTVEIRLRANEDKYEVIFNVKDLRIDSNYTELRLANSNQTVELEDQEQIPSERFRITTKEPLKKGETYVLVLKYDTDFNSHLLGIYNSRYFDGRNKKTKSLVSTQFSPIDARRGFPCFDEPSFKSIFSISIARPTSLSTVSNMPKKGDPQPFEDRKDWVWDHYEDTPPIPTYLVAFVISDFKSATASRPSTELWATQSFLSQTQYAADLLPVMINYLQSYLNVSFPVKKLDLVAIPEFGFGAMENWGLITFRESMLLFDRNNTSIEDQKNIAHVLAHELAHQWFGNLVTPKWWDDLWLKEGFSTYLSYLAVAKAHPKWTYTQEIFPNELTKALENDAYLSSEAVSKQIKNNKQIRQIFGAGSYSKGACLVRMLNNFLTEPTFLKGVKYYLDRYKFKNADHKDLLKCFDDAAAENVNPFVNFTNVGDIMENWISKPGFPVLTITTNMETKAITIRQKRFSLEGSSDDTLWWVPISIATDLDPDFRDSSPKAWLQGESITLPVNFANWYIVNVNQTGYYMVNYDEQIWRALIKDIMNVPPLTRAQLIGDSMELAKANLLDYDIPLRLIANMAVNDKMIMFVPTLVAFNKLEFLSDMLINTPAFGLFENYHKTIFKDTYHTVDFSNTLDDYLSLRIMKTVLEWSCRSVESRCAILAHSLYRKWMQGSIVIQPNVRHIVYCTAIRQGGKAEWDFAYHEYRRTNSPTEKNVLLDALGCTKQEWLLSRMLKAILEGQTSYLNIVLDDETYSMRIQDADRIFESIANNKAGSQLAFNFLRRNWDDLREHLGEGFDILNKLILSIPKHMNTEFQLAELQKFKEELGDRIGHAGPALDRAIEIVRTKVVWMQKNYKSLEQWLYAHQDNFGYGSK
ncbi:aminopeptidase N-like isoform X2 [Coccinella septempunctata]|uniref:aminopeptidase N-like isoform X2 n=1 Tax=Coccinella septempunctata TaxID=41139 RepID=UPI001D06DB91|nr:aminopeptidase N-like isoform X2 [Coccinella septempunctata]